MKKKELIERLLTQEEWEDTFNHFARIGMEKSTKKELLKFLDKEEEVQ